MEGTRRRGRRRVNRRLNVRKRQRGKVVRSFCDVHDLGFFSFLLSWMEANRRHENMEEKRRENMKEKGKQRSCSM